jgi:hypothetical protein
MGVFSFQQLRPLGMCPNCGGKMNVIAFITERKPTGKILRHIGALDHAPAISPA